MVTLLVIADDLTGAADAGAQLAARGVSAYIRLGAGADPPHGTEVLVISTDSRHRLPDEAAAAVRGAVEHARAAGVQYVFKKTDSTLRGNIGAELDAALRGSGRRALAFVPSHPALGRTTREGRQYVHGVPLDATAFARDPLEPAVTSSVAEVLARQSDIRTVVVSFGEAGAGPDHTGSDRVILILDAESGDGLRRAGEWIASRGLLALTAGTAGFAALLPDLLGLTRRPSAELPRVRRMLAVTGSLHEASLRQAAYASCHGFRRIVVPPALLLESGCRESSEAGAFADRAAEIARRGEHVLLVTAGDTGEVAACVEAGVRAGLTAPAVHETVAAGAGRVALAVADRAGVELLAVVGGDTLGAVARLAGWRGLVPQAEILPGVALCAVDGGRGPRFAISKPGGFGDEDVLVELRKRMEAATP